MKLSCSCNCHNYKSSDRSSCACCEGAEILTPKSVVNQPGLYTLAYRVGTHASFFETMQARLGDSKFPQLRNLKTRDSNDPSIALLDAWATVADVLTFYQERIANEGYLRTAIERGSLVELARLVDYAHSPGVSASVYLAFTVEDGYNLEIPIGLICQSIPNSDESPEFFETSEKLRVYAQLNRLKPRLKQQQEVNSKAATEIDKLYLDGIGANLKPNDPLLLIFGDAETEQVIRKVQIIEPQPEENRTKITLQLPPEVTQQPTTEVAPASTKAQKIKQLIKLPSIQPANALELERSKEQIFSPANIDINSRLINNTLNPADNTAVYQILTSDRANSANQLNQIKVLGIKAAPFGHDVQLKPIFDQQGRIEKYEEWQISGVDEPTSNSSNTLPSELRNILVLDAQYDEITPGSWLAIERVDVNEIGIYQVIKVENFTKIAYNTVGRITQLTLDKPWLKEQDTSLDVMRKTTVYLKSEDLNLVEKPVDLKDAPSSEHYISDQMEIELDNLYEGLQPGRWLIISGERSDISGVNGVWKSEVVMLAGVRQDINPNLPNDKPHTFLRFARPLAYTYKRETVTIYGNVVKATHGETHTEILGSGDATKANQQFTLSQPPLTYLPAPNPSGVASSLSVYVNDVRWQEVESLIQLSPTDRAYITQTDSDGNVTIIFGNGEHGARLPSGVENIMAVYRSGIGKSGNVGAEKIAQLAMQPLGLSGVLNPIAATGGADPESDYEIRRNASVGVTSLNRAVSVQDYANFARTFTGIGKANAQRLSNGSRQIIHITIAGADDIYIDRNSDLYRSFVQALYEFGDPNQALKVDMRELMLLIISANVRILANYQWTSVALKIRTALFDKFSFERQELGQDVALSAVIGTIQQVPGVDYVDVDILDSVSETEAQNPDILNRKLEELAQLGIGLGNGQLPIQPKQRIPVNLAVFDSTINQLFPAQLAILSPQVPDTLILKELKS
ncbi:putative baseplate assembly protein [Nostocaceae cyanobacterium CENA369]|uniref:Putative baseplate assembly protein n=1 Tax=Dendronalium phyllosphericum CENA369 TaxID=1725256 RepID=A0A8J7I8K9_9NOST|nr:putative baseplate assembly protein [Dendronalium phyllosphericum]MBH8578160.1 putative baseplate assembly protein [Dendronalium phyllosphericum CENA369]